MKKILFILGCLLALNVSANESQLLEQKLLVESKLLGKNIEVEVNLPEQYLDNNYHYPVMYYLDASQNVKHISGTLDVLNRTGSVPSIIAVGIESYDRDSDFKPQLDANNKVIAQGAELFHRFITDELMPLIEKRYRTHPFKILQGHSLGGLFAGYSMIHHPQTFDAYIVISPAFWWQNNWIINLAKQHYQQNATMNKSAFFVIGDEDGQGMQQELKAFYDALPQSTKQAGNIQHKVLPNEGHMSAPLLGNYYGLLHIFKTMHYDRSRWPSFTVQDFKAHEALIVKQYGPAAKQNEESYAFLGSHLLFKQNYLGAIAVNQYRTKYYPDNHYSFEALAQAYELNNQTEEAISAYRQAYKISTEQKNGSFQAEIYLKKIEVLQLPATISLLDDYVGEYQSPDSKIIIRREGTRLKGFVDGLGDFDLFQEGEHLYRLKLVGATLLFAQDESGKTVKMIIDQGQKEEAIKVLKTSN